jgi:DNA-binding transcriptional ArsR family regulator
VAVTAPTLDDVFKALADPTRRSVVERLGVGPASTTALARPFLMALPSFSQHLDVLERSGLVVSSKQGRVRMYRLTPEPLSAAGSWLDAQREHWSRRLDQLDHHLLNMKDPR